MLAIESKTATQIRLMSMDEPSKINLAAINSGKLRFVSKNDANAIAEVLAKGLSPHYRRCV